MKEITYKYRRDFIAVYTCEYCGYEEPAEGCGDAYYHNNVAYAMSCKQCGKTSSESYEPILIKYPEGFKV